MNLFNRLGYPKGTLSGSFLISSLLITSALTYQPSAFAGEIYRWVDRKGVVNYTQQKPKGIAAQKITTRSGGPSVVTKAPADTMAFESSSSANNQPKLTDEQQQALDKLKASEVQRQANITQVKAANCQKATALLDRLTVNQRIRIRDEQGKERTLAEDERQSRIAEAQKGIAINCLNTELAKN